MEIGHLLKTLIELSYFAHTDTGVHCEQSETFGAGIKIRDILEVFIDCIHRSYSEAATKRTVAYLPSIVSSWVGGLLSGTELVTLISPTVKAE